MWREVLAQAFRDCELDEFNIYERELALLCGERLLAMPLADRIAFARELLAGTGRVVARDVGERGSERESEGWPGPNDGWNACRAAMLADPDA